MKTKYPYPIDAKSIGSHLNGHSQLRPLLQKARKIIALNQILVKVLSKELIPHCNVMNVSGETLVIEIDNAAWATRLRFIEPSLLKKLSLYPAASTIKKLQYKVRAKQNSSPSTQNPKLTLSTQSTALLQELSHSVDCPELSTSLKRLLQPKLIS